MQSTYTLLCEYVYDALDRLVNQHQPAAPAHQRFYCKSRLATEIHGALKHSILQHDDLLLAEQRHEGVSADTTLLATDLQRSVLNTVTQGVKPQPIAYSPYGHRPPLGGLLSLLGFNGERPDPLTGHYLLGNGYRAFNPVLMRFNSPDSWSPFRAGGLNPYCYCLGNPIGSVDPSGHLPVTSLAKSTLYFRKSSSSSIPRIIVAKSSKTTPISTSTLKTFKDGSILEQTTTFTKRGAETTSRLQVDGIVSLSRPGHPDLEYLATPSLLDSAYRSLPSTAIGPEMRNFATSIVPESMDLRNAHNHLAKITFELSNNGTPRSELVPLARTIQQRDLNTNKIAGAFPERLLGVANSIRH